MMYDWISVRQQLPPFDVLVKVRLLSGVELVDFVNRPFDKECPFQHFIVSDWRYMCSGELNELLGCLRDERGVVYD